MANRMMPDTPREAHLLASAIGRDAANQRMRKAGRKAWNRADANVCAATVQEMYQVFGILNAEQWMPEGFEWAKDGNSIKPVAKTRAA